MIFAKFLHVLGFTIWVGGMFFAYMALRPVAATRLEPPQRLSLWEGVFCKFFPWVWLCVATILASGLYMMAQLGKPPMYVSAMFGLGIIMMMLFAHVFFAPFKRLKRAVAAQDWQAGGAALGQIRMLVGINLSLGLVTIVVGTLGALLVS
ncbi:CopD family protein [Sulfuriferula sp. GW1]|uniref:CopD family protein n=1 Tax=Sulfuriferula sp. GW1 TaxID=3345111 RepID=UPI0039AF1019